MFVEKLNKKQSGTYIIEEEKTIAGGKWEGFLDHDNVNHQSISIYTGPKYTGEKVENFFISTPSETPWKTHIKAFSSSEKIYITYETTGDQVEAEDINELQEAIADTSNNLNDYKDSNNREIRELKNRTTSIENNKANKTYVDTELNKKANKDNVFTKEEVLQKIQEIIGAAPEALDTLEKLATALDNDPNFATNIINLLSTKVDKEQGKGLSTEDYTTEEKQKLLGIEVGANKYIHPATHSADIIVQNANKRFVTDAEKANWNTKETPEGSQAKADNTLKVAKEHTDTHDSNTIKHITSAERNKWNTIDNKVDKVTSKGLSTEDYTTGEKSKLSGISVNANKVEKSTINGNIKIDGLETEIYKHPGSGTNPHGTTKADVGLSNVDNIKQVSKTEFDTHNNDSVRHITATERTKWNTIGNKADKTYVDETFATKQELSGAGNGDMLKSIYDKNNNGKVDVAEVADSVPWTGITGKPSTFIPSSHTHTKSQISDFPNSLPANGGFADGFYMMDTRDVIDKPSDLMSKKTTGMFKRKPSVGNPPVGVTSTYVFIINIIGWSTGEGSGGWPIQLAFGTEGIAYRQAVNADTWGNWTKIANVNDIPTKLSQLTNDVGYLKSLPAHNHDTLYMKKGPLTCNDLKGV